MLKMALAEDAARHDMTSRSVIPRERRIKATILAKEPGILAGIDLAARVFKLQDKNLSVRTLKKDGSAIKHGQALLTVERSAHSIFAAERTALNFLGHLSGIATLTQQCVQRVRGTRAAIYDTRKTLPGLRLLEKYAVRVGGGQSHRADLAEAVLIKTNHLRVVSGQWSVTKEVIQRTIRDAKRKAKDRCIEVEVTSLDDLEAALEARPDAILLDNWTVGSIKQAVRLRRHWPLATGHWPLLEVSGGVTFASVRAIAKTGVERISIGRLTHSAPSLDVSLQVLA